jgi:hypothetical protein
MLTNTLSNLGWPDPKDTGVKVTDLLLKITHEQLALKM